MPRLNGAGPQGAGPMTGRGMGNCNNANANAPMYGRAFGFGKSRGFGRGQCRGFGFAGNYGANYYTAAEITPEQQKDMLNQDKAFLENELKRIDEQIDKI